MTYLNRSFKPAHGPRSKGGRFRILKDLQVNVPDDWHEQRPVNTGGWVDLPATSAKEQPTSKLIIIPVKDDDGIRYRVLDKNGFDELVERINSPGVLASEMGARDKGDFFGQVDAVEYDPSGKVRLKAGHLDRINAKDEVEVRTVDGKIEIRCPDPPCD